ncbi:ATP-dependent helicase [Terribacillus saccharophilus]|uniref:ATP-dependent helicase n=1 Tax=Terribacillus saccharophilus TaxID=361277 RepID=UPI00159533AA|nr:ATP-dependent helicase [Terribacillus saccharophilus]
MNDLYKEKLKLLENDREQYIAFNAKKSIVIKAGPGSGKTNVLTLKLAKILKERVFFPRKVACITFSNEAAKEIKKRTYQLIDYNQDNLLIGTIHSFCLSQILKPFVGLFNCGINRDFEIISKKEKIKWINEIKQELEIPDVLTVIDIDKERTHMTQGDSQVYVESYDIAFKVAQEYEKRLLMNNMVDFLSIIKISTNLIQTEPYLRKYLEAKFPYILIDEYQDLGKPLHEMVLTLVEKTNINLVVVGDPNQTIYGFNGAIPSYLLELEGLEQFESVELKNNYRSHQSILDASSISLGLPVGFFTAKTSFDNVPEMNLMKFKGNHSSQYRYIAKNIIPNLLNKGFKYSDIAILIRAKNKVKECKKIFEECNIPHYVMTFDFNRGRFIRFLEDCAAWVLGNRQVYFKDILAEWLSFKYDTKPFNYEASEERVFLYLTLVQSKKFISRFLRWFAFIYKELDIKNIISTSKHTDDHSDLRDFANFLSNDGNNLDINTFSNLSTQGNSVSLLTMHSAKGLEYEIVIMPAMEEGTFPFYKVKDSEIDEEKRLFFVSLTRAKSRCYFLMSKTLYGYAKKPSRFLDDIEFTSITE